MEALHVFRVLRTFIPEALVDLILNYLMQNIWDNNTKRCPYARPCMSQWTPNYLESVFNKPKAYFFHHPVYAPFPDYDRASDSWKLLSDFMWIWVKHKHHNRLWMVNDSQIEDVIRYCITNKLFRPRLDIE